MVCYCNKRKIIFIHVPKTGGLTVEQILIKNYGFKYFTFKTGRYDFLNDPEGKEGFFRYILKYSKESKRYNLREFKTFAFVRNPYSRAMSSISFLSKVFDVIPQNTEIMLRKTRMNTYCYVHFNLSQTECLKNDDGELNIDYIGKFENFTEELERILFIELKLPYSNIRNIHKNKSSRKLNLDNERIFEEVRIIHSEDFLNFNYEL